LQNYAPDTGIVYGARAGKDFFGCHTIAPQANVAGIQAAVSAVVSADIGKLHYAAHYYPASGMRAPQAVGTPEKQPFVSGRDPPGK